MSRLNGLISDRFAGPARTGDLLNPTLALLTAALSGVPERPSATACPRDSMRPRKSVRRASRGQRPLFLLSTYRVKRDAHSTYDAGQARSSRRRRTRGPRAGVNRCCWSGQAQSRRVSNDYEAGPARSDTPKTPRAAAFSRGNPGRPWGSLSQAGTVAAGKLCSIERQRLDPQGHRTREGRRYDRPPTLPRTMIPPRKNQTLFHSFNRQRRRGSRPS